MGWCEEDGIDDEGDMTVFQSPPLRKKEVKSHAEHITEWAGIDKTVTEPKNAADYLSEGAATYRERNAVYGDNYKQFGNVMKGLFPKGLRASTVDEFNRLGVLVQVVSKVSRMAENFNRGGHADSTHDLMVYAAMLAELEDGNGR
jgi:hypothetical protein